MIRTAAIAAFLDKAARPWLATRYHEGMEVQVMAARDGAEIVARTLDDGKRVEYYTDGKYRWFSYRIPHKAGTNPTYKEQQQHWSLYEHCEAVGLTGWDFEHKVSRFVIFDIDAMMGHKAGLSPERMEEVQSALLRLDYGTMWVSTGGIGRHFCIDLAEPVPTANHKEHAALGRAIQAQIAGHTGLDLAADVDAAGQNTWIWARRQIEASYQVVSEKGPFTAVPQNWRDYLTKSRKWSRDGGDKEIQNPTIPLEPAHVTLIDWLREHSRVHWWDAEYHLLTAHTLDLLEAHTELGLKGRFHTTSSGSTAHNCFMFPLRGGGWSVRRYGGLVQECPLWEACGDWTHILYNALPGLHDIYRALGAKPDSSGEFWLAHAPLKEYFGEVIPDTFEDRQHRLEVVPDGFSLIVAKQKRESDDYTGWNKKRGYYEFTFQWEYDQSSVNFEPDDRIRKTYRGSDSEQWLIKLEQGWTSTPYAEVKNYIQGAGVAAGEINLVLRSYIDDAYEIVNEPFRPEYPGPRKWNRQAAQLIVEPDKQVDMVSPTWRSMLEHMGRGINTAVAENEWCQRNSITDGGQYLEMWLAIMFQDPSRRLPYLFFWSTESNTGKSTFWESLALLVSPNAFCQADHALTGAFNGEMESAVVCVVDEADLSQKPEVYNKLKLWITGDWLSVRALYRQATQVQNNTHWIHTANYLDYCPVQPGDSRMVVVPTYALENWLPKITLFKMLKAEAPQFLGRLMSLIIPPLENRLILPVLDTPDRRMLISCRSSLIQQFLSINDCRANGAMVEFSKLHESITAISPPGDSRLARLHDLNWMRVELGSEYPIGQFDGKTFVGNIYLEGSKPKHDFRWVMDPRGGLTKERICENSST